MQALPIVGLLLDIVAPRLVSAGLLAAGTLSVTVVGATFAQAVAGRPFF
jgi:hypothetical protein